MRIIRNGNPECVACDYYKLECLNCGCVFIFDHTEIISQGRKLGEEAIIRCPYCNQLIHFIPVEHLYDEDAECNISSPYLSTASNRVENQSTESSIYHHVY